MPRFLRYLTHPQVTQDPAIPVPQWHLSAIGRQRLISIGKPKSLLNTVAIVASAETKAVETADILADALDIPVKIRERMHENDRSATGYLKPSEFEAVANEFFAKPNSSIRGWERALDAQRRIVDEVNIVLQQYEHGDLLFVGHGAVGTLLYCHLAAIPINRKHDQLAGGGHFFTVSLDNNEVIHEWKPIEDI